MEKARATSLTKVSDIWLLPIRWKALTTDFEVVDTTGLQSYDAMIA